MNPSHNFLEHVAQNITLMAILIVLVAAVAFFAAKMLGGESRAKRKFIFTLIGGIGLSLVAIYISNQI